MAIKKIMVPLGSNARNQAVLETALVAAQRFRAHLEVLYIRPDPRLAIPYATLGMSGSMKKTVMESARQSANEQAAKTRAAFEKFCGKHGIPIVKRPPAEAPVSASWREGVGNQSAVVAQRGLYADLIVVPRPAAASAEMLEAALLQTGQPVLIVPPQSQECVASKIVIGWNASAEAARAVAAAMPCLTVADAVTILISPKRAASAKDLAGHLVWHGVKASVRQFRVGTRSVGETLLAEARALKADLLVIGGYSHVRARELLFGGVTRHILAATEIPVLMAH
ncbi:MAG: universal stress protein [Nitrospira sp.]|nr:universal stress protein [Nitrospira sp.]